MPGKLGIAPRPRGDEWLIDDIRSLKAGGVNLLVCLLEDSELAELGLHDESKAAETCGIDFMRYPIPDYGVPSSVRETLSVATSLLRRVQAGDNVVLHCRQGIGRSTILAASVLVAGREPVDRALAAVAAARGCRVPDTEEQIAWIARLSEFLSAM